MFGWSLDWSSLFFVYLSLSLPLLFQTRSFAGSAEFLRSIRYFELFGSSADVKGWSKAVRLLRSWVSWNHWKNSIYEDIQLNTNKCMYVGNEAWGGISLKEEDVLTMIKWGKRWKHSIWFEYIANFPNMAAMAAMTGYALTDSASRVMVNIGI